jgi:hypothetical protein
MHNRRLLKLGRLAIRNGGGWHGSVIALRGVYRSWGAAHSLRRPPVSAVDTYEL